MIAVADARWRAPRTVLTVAVPFVVRAKNALDGAEPAWNARGSVSNNQKRRVRTLNRPDRGEPLLCARRTAATARNAPSESVRLGPRRTHLPARPNRPATHASADFHTR